MAGGNERRPAPPLVQRAQPPPARPKRKEARTLEVDCTAIAALMNADPAAPAPVDLDADIEVVSSDPRMATPTRSGRLAHTKPRVASGSGAINPMPAAAIADGVPEPLEDRPTAASAVLPAARELPLVAPPDPEPVASISEALQMEVPQPARVRRVTLGRIVFVMCVAAAWCAAAFAV